MTPNPYLHLQYLTGIGIPTVTPNSNLPGTAALTGFVGSVLMIALILCLAGLVVGSLAWAVSGRGANMRGSNFGRDLVIGSFIGAFLAGGGHALISYFFTAGSGIH
ncbi:MAG: DUF6112 family protein [Acidimicrobiales bacterium]